MCCRFNKRTERKNIFLTRLNERIEQKKKGKEKLKLKRQFKDAIALKHMHIHKHPLQLYLLYFSMSSNSHLFFSFFIFYFNFYQQFSCLVSLAFVSFHIRFRSHLYYTYLFSILNNFHFRCSCGRTQN